MQWKKINHDKLIIEITISMTTEDSIWWAENIIASYRTAIVGRN